MRASRTCIPPLAVPVLALLAAVLALAAPAQAAFPGRNGLIGFNTIYGVEAIAADGSGHVALSEQERRGMEAAWSPDGRLLAFRSGLGADGTASTRLPYVAVENADGTGLRILTQGDQPAWSPDGRWLAFSRIDPVARTRDVWIIRSDGTDERRLTYGAASERSPAWSPDGARIAFVTNRDPGADGTPNVEIYSMNADGSDQRNLTNDPAGDDHPNWSPDGARIAFDRNPGASDIWLMNADGGGQRQLTANRHSQQPAWSPDGTRIVFAQQAPQDDPSYPWSYKLWLMTAGGADLGFVRQVPAPGDMDPDWAVVPSADPAQPPPDQPPPPVVEPDPPAAPAPGVARLRTRGATLSRRGRLTLRLSCPAGSAGCVGRISLRSTRRIACKGARARLVAFGSARYRIATGASRRVIVRVPRAGRVVLACRRRVRARATLRASNGARRRVATLVLRARR